MESARETLKSEEFTSNKKRQELSDQLKQISLKIDQEIMELKKQNTNNASSSHHVSVMTGSYNMNNTSRDSFNGQQGSYISSSARKKSEGSSSQFANGSSLIGSKEIYPPSRDSLPNSMNQSLELSNRESFQSQYKGRS